MSYRLSLLRRDACVNGANALYNKGTFSNTATLNIYSNATSQPATPETAVPSGSIVLATVAFSSVAFANSVTSTGVANALPLQAIVQVTGTPAWFRTFDGSGTPRALDDGSVTVNGGGGDMTFDNVSFVSGGTVNINTFSVAAPM